MPSSLNTTFSLQDDHMKYNPNSIKTRRFINNCYHTVKTQLRNNDRNGNSTKNSTVSSSNNDGSGGGHRNNDSRKDLRNNDIAGELPYYPGNY